MAPVGLRNSAGNLPVELTSFVGRRLELAELTALLSRTRLLTLSGMGGVGKTRLARRLAGDVHRAFPDGVWQVELADLREPALLVPTIAAALGLFEQNRRWTISTLQEQLKDRQLLLLLDNCEHLIHACAVVADALLSSCPDVRILATSREPLGIGGEQTYPVRPLSVPDPEHLASTDLGSYESVSLLLDRATAVLPGFSLEDNRQAVAQLVTRLDGVPLAIELAALRLRALSPEQILAQFDRRYLGNTGSRTAPQRQQSLRALVDWSYQLCSEQEQLLWCVLSVFVRGFELYAAEALCADTELGGAEVTELVVGLVEKSVLVREEHAGRVRLRMPEIIRAYGLDRLRKRRSGVDTGIRTSR
jgi:predicted ATPase